MVVYTFGSYNVMGSTEFLNSSEEGFTSLITRSPTGYWNPLVAPDRLPKLLSCPYRQYVLAGNKNLQKICIEDTAHKHDWTSKMLQKQEGTSDSLRRVCV